MAHFPDGPALVDVVITHPLASPDLLRAAVKGGTAACAAEAAKCRKYANSGAGASVFIPLALKMYGRAGPAA